MMNDKMNGCRDGPRSLFLGVDPSISPDMLTQSDKEAS